MKSRNKVVAGIGGAAVVAGIIGMGSFALWNDSAETDAGVVTAGNLDVDTVGLYWDDISDDLPKAGIADVDNWQVSPGDTLQLQVELDVALEGENLAANLDVTDLKEALVEANVQDLVTLDVVLNDADDQLIVPNADGTYRFSPQSSVNGGQELGGVKVPDALEGTADAKAVVTIHVKDTVAGDELENLVLADFTDASVTLTQVREGQGFIE